MSSDALPITTGRFASALKDLSLESLHAKVAELRNSIRHLKKSNAEIEEFIRSEGDGGEADRELMEVILENRGVLGRFEERILLVRREVEARGMPFPEEEEEKEGEKGDGSVEMVDGAPSAGVDGAGEPASREVRPAAQNQAANGRDQEEEGVFL